ncbi:thiol-disulfide oxidoreductase ResA [Chungangia koreensis]|uniref:thiol-disulfide oxidoreductase ResA n=1 Tax=Chungangia koreensis TaxID=752657 RepID=UPI00366FB32B
MFAIIGDTKPFAEEGEGQLDRKKKRTVIRTVILGILAAAIIYTIYISATKDKVKLLEVGDQAPDFALTDLEGNSHKLSDYKGQGVFLNFWGTWCEPCVEEMPAIDRQYNKFEQQGVHVLSVNIAQSNMEVSSFRDQLNLKFPIVIDKNKSVMEAYNVTWLPATVLVNPEGKIEKIYTGGLTDENIAKFMESIKPE